MYSAIQFGSHLKPSWQNICRAWFTILCFLMVSPFCQSKDISQSKEIRMVTVEWPPFQGPDLAKQGYTAEIARQALARRGYHFQLDFLPWARAVREAEKGNYHALFNPWKNEALQNSFLFSNEVLGSGSGHFLSLPNAPYDNLTPENLKGMRIGFVRGYPLSEELQLLIDNGAIKTVEVVKIRQLITLLWKSRIDLIVENYTVAQHIFNREFPGQPFDLRVAGKDLIDGDLYIAWSKNHEHSATLRDEFDSSIREMYENGMIEDIKKEFGIEDQ